MKILKYLKSVIVISSITLLAACSGQDNTTGGSSVAGLGVQVKTETTNTDKMPLLDSLAALYPRGQMSDVQKQQAAIELGQNPAALRMKASSKAFTKSISSVNQGSGFAPQTGSNTYANAATTSAAANFAPVARIQNTTLSGSYFFTIYDSEKTSALALHPEWNYEGAAFYASLVPDTVSNTGLFPVYTQFMNLNVLTSWLITALILHLKAYHGMRDNCQMMAMYRYIGLEIP
jgi:hypothetical protein